MHTSDSGITVTLQENEDKDLVMDFPFELLEALGWRVGDSINIDTFAGRIILSKSQNLDPGGGEETYTLVQG